VIAIRRYPSSRPFHPNWPRTFYADRATETCNPDRPEGHLAAAVKSTQTLPSQLGQHEPIRGCGPCALLLTFLEQGQKLTQKQIFGGQRRAAPKQSSAKAERVGTDDLYGKRKLREPLEYAKHFEMVSQLSDCLPGLIQFLRTTPGCTSIRCCGAKKPLDHLQSNVNCVG
jgi:hypothetical protein